MQDDEGPYRVGSPKLRSEWFFAPKPYLEPRKTCSEVPDCCYLIGALHVFWVLQELSKHFDPDGQA